MSGYVNTLQSLDAEIKRLNRVLRNLRLQKQEQQRLLKDYMETCGYTEYEGVKLDSLVKRQRKPRKKKAEKEADGISLLREIGVPNPGEFYEKFRKTQV
jgi:hypothetical protein